MSKIKSAICLVLFSLLIAALCFVCTVSFSYGTDGVHTFNSIVRMTAKDADLGASFGAEGYLGGGYSAVYYPEGVISAKEYEDTLGGYADAKDKEDYAAKYETYKNGTLYLDKEKVCANGTEPSADFKARFEKTVEVLTARFAALRKDGVRLDVRDDYTVRVFLPKDLMTNEFYAIAANAYLGQFSVRLGSSESEAKTILPARSDKPITDYVKGASSRTAADGTAYIVINFTKAGREAIKDATTESSTGTMYFSIGDNTVIPLSVSSAIDQSSLYISGTYSTEAAAICAKAINTALSCTVEDELLTLTVGDSYSHTALYGNYALYAMYIAFGAIFVGMMIFFFVRYHRLAFVHLFTYLIFMYIMLVCVWAIPFCYLSTETFVAFLLASLLLCLGNVLVFESARKEYALGKTMVSSVKTAYKKNFWHLFDLFIAIAGFAFIVFGIAITNLSAFAFVLGLGTVYAGLCVLGLNRFMWAVMMSFTPNKGGFCNFKREEVEDDD